MKYLNLKNKFILTLCISVIVISISICTILTLKYKSHNNNSSNKSNIETNNSEEIIKENTTTLPHSYDWNSETEYKAGDIVSFNSKLYKAKWWTKGESPEKSGEWGVWALSDSDVSSTTTPASTEDDSTNDAPSSENLSKSDFKVVGYFPEWKPQKESEIQYNKLTHINYSFAIPNSDGTIKPLKDPNLANKIIKNGHKNGVKVLIAVGGWEYNGTPLEPTFISATDSNEKCKTLADSILDLVDKYNFDGIDMDWEHPRTDGPSKDQYATLLKYLREGIDKRDKLLTSAVLAGVNADGGVLWDSAGHTDKALSCVDWVNVMAYDGGDGDRHSSLKFSQDSANYWLKKRKLPPSKVVVGVPFYARPTWASYEDILKADSNAYKKDSAMLDGKEAYYNGIDTIVNKTKWAMKNTSGIMIWEISQDVTNEDKSLLNAIYETVK